MARPVGSMGAHRVRPPWRPEDEARGPEDFPVTAADAARYLARAAEYAALWARAEDAVERHRLARAVKDYVHMASRVRG